MDNIFKSYSTDNLKWYKSKIDLEYLVKYSRNIQKDLIHRCDWITASSHNKELFQYFLKDLDFTNSNQKNIDISTIWLLEFYNFLHLIFKDRCYNFGPKKIKNYERRAFTIFMAASDFQS